MDTVNPGRRRLLGAGLAAGVGSLVLPAAAADASGQTDQNGGPATARGPVPPSPQLVHAETTSAATASLGSSVEDNRELISDPGSDFMVETLRAAGVPYVSFMVGSTFRGLQESLVNYDPEKNPGTIICVHEEVSAAFAHGYFKVSGKPMACLVHSTVGLQHASMAIYNAWCDRVPIIVVAANVLDATVRRPGVEWLHTAVDVGAFVRDYVKWDDNPVSLQHFAESFMHAQALAMTPPYAPVLIVADGELQERQIADRSALSIPRAMAVSPAGIGEPLARRIADMLIAAERPVIVADRSARTQDGVDLLKTLAELVNAPVIDLAGRMNMPNTHYLNQSSLSGELLSKTDLVLALEVGDLYGLVNRVSDLTERKSRRIIPAFAKVIGVSAIYGAPKNNIQDAQRYFPADILVDADAEASLPGLISQARQRLTPDRAAQLAARTPVLQAAYRAMRAADADAAAIGWDATPISTARMCMELWERIKGLDWALVSSTIFISSWPQRLWDIDKHYQYIGTEGGFGLGYGVPGAAGAAQAHHDAGRLPVAITTDGDMLMLPGALWTLAHHKIPLLTVMHNNRAWHQETMHLQRMTNRRNRGAERWRIGTVIDDPFVDYASVAKGMGVWAEGPITNPDHLGDAISRALKVVQSGRPALLDVVTQPR